MDLAELRDFALALSDDADRIALAHFGGPVPAVTKPDGTPVTEADQAIERSLRQRIGAAYPRHAVFGEEQGGELDPGTPTWVIDPIDGTKNYMRGIPVFGTLIAVVEQREPVVGVVSAPALRERWDAARGLGARRNGRGIGVSAVADLADADVCYGDPERFREVPGLWTTYGELVDRTRRMRGFGDFWMHLQVAAGTAEAAFERELPPWDVAAVACIVTEAGGRITRFDGAPVLDPPRDGPDGVLSSNGHVHEKLRALLERAVRV